MKEAAYARDEENKVKKEAGARGRSLPCSGGSIPRRSSTTWGQFGFDGAWIETEHGTLTWDQVAHMSRACDLWDMTSVCRVNHNEPWLIPAPWMWVLRA